jgi:hypothetical protein
MDVLYRFRRGLQGNRLVALVYLVFLVGLVHLVYLVQPNIQDKPNKPDEPLGLGLADRLSLFPFEFSPAVIEPFCGCAGCVERR